MVLPHFYTKVMCLRRNKMCTREDVLCLCWHAFVAPLFVGNMCDRASVLFVIGRGLLWVTRYLLFSEVYFACQLLLKQTWAAAAEYDLPTVEWHNQIPTGILMHRLSCFVCCSWHFFMSYEKKIKLGILLHNKIVLTKNKNCNTQKSRSFSSKNQLKWNIRLA